MRHLHQFTGVAVAAVCLGLTLNTGARGDSLLSNGDFSQGSSTTATTFTGHGYGGLSAAAHWTVYNNSAHGTTFTQLVASTAPGAVSGDTMIHVITTGNRDGIVQAFAPLGTGSTLTFATANVFVLSGDVTLATGNGGNTGSDVVSSTNNTWESLSAFNGHTPANEVILYSQHGPADFYVDFAKVTVASNGGTGGGSAASVPEPATFVSLGTGVALTLLGWGWRKGKRSAKTENA